MIADNVGDNVGDCAGMAADLFETYAVTAVAVMLLGVLTFQRARPRSRSTRSCSAASRSSPRSSARSPCARTTGNVERALYQGLVVSGVIAAVAFYPITNWLMDGLHFTASAARSTPPSVSDLYLCSLDRHRRHALLFVITDYYTSTRFAPGQEDRRGVADRPRDEHHPGLAQGLQATALPALVLVLGILGSWKLAGGGTRASTASASRSWASSR